MLKITRYINGIKVNKSDLPDFEIKSEAVTKAIRRLKNPEGDGF